MIEEVDAQQQTGTSSPVNEAMAGFGSSEGGTTWSTPTGMALLSLHWAPYAVYPTGVDKASHAV